MKIDIEKFRQSLRHPKLPKMTLEQIVVTENSVIEFTK